MSTPPVPVIDLCKVVRRGNEPPLSGVRKLTRTRPVAILVVLSLVVIGSLASLFIPILTCLLNYLRVIRHIVLRKLFDLCVGCWIAFVSIIFEFVYGIKTRIFGYRGRFKKRCVFIMNHVSHLDWLYFWTVVIRQGDVSKWKVVTKSNIRNLPVLGQCMQCACLLFIERNWEQDEAEFTNKLDYFNSLSYPCQLLLFPEGGDLTYKSKSKSNSYADQQGLPNYHYCLHPRTKGFTHIIGKMREVGLDAIYDVTIGFPDTLPKTEMDFLGGTTPRQIDFHIKSHDNSEIPTDENELSKWCQERWQEKEELLRGYYTNGSFDDNQSKSGTKKLKDTSNDSTSWSRSTYMMLLLVFTLVPAILLHLWWGPMFTFFVFSLIFTIWLCKYGVGFDGLVLWLHRQATQEFLASKKNRTQ